MTDIKRFVIKYGLENAYINKLQLLVEEFLVSFFKPNAGKGEKLRIVLKYDKKTDKAICYFLHNIKNSILDEDLETISAQLINNLAVTINESQSDISSFDYSIACIV